MSTAEEKLVAVTRATLYSRRAIPKLIAQGILSQGQASQFLKIMDEVAADYRAQASDAKNLTPSDGSGFRDAGMSSTLNTPKRANLEEHHQCRNDTPTSK